MRSVYPILTLLLTLSLLFAACNRSGKAGSFSRYFHPDSLSSFLVEIDISRDTVLLAPGGSEIRIPAHALDAGGPSRVKLVIREALKIGDIIRAGLLTRSNGEVLSSGGMIDIEAAEGQTVKILQPIAVRLPTPYLDKKMQLYKGVADEQGKINWVDPVALPIDSAAALIDIGEEIFVRRCASCHAIGKIVTGPDLAYIPELRDKMWLRNFLHDNQAMIRSGDRYANCLYNYYNKTAMNVFPVLSGEAMDLLLLYIDNESKRRHLPYPDDHLKKCSDSCAFYDKTRDSLRALREKLIKGNNTQVAVKNTPVAGYVSPDTVGNTPKLVAPIRQSEYYQFNITSFGWYNIDMVLQKMDGVKESQLIIRMRGVYRAEVNVFLVIPSARVFQEGGPLDGKENEYGFYSVDGRLPLPQGAPAMVIAMGEKNGKLAFGMTSFVTMESQSPELEPLMVSKEAMNAQLQGLNLEEMNMQVRDSKNADSVRKTDLELKDIERFKPRTCDCHCGSPIQSDSAR